MALTALPPASRADHAPDPGAGLDAGFVVELPEFSGPLDLLLSLIRDEQLDVYDIPIARVAQQFLARVHALGLDDAADYLDMAARLLRIKAQLLLPRPGGADDLWEDPRAELVRRLLEYQQVREVVAHLDDLAERRRGRFGRGAVFARHSDGEAEPLPVPLALSLGELLGSVDRVLRAVRRPAVHDVVPRALDVAGAIADVRALLARRAFARWGDVMADDAEPWRVLSALLALLELAKLGEVRLAQESTFGEVTIARAARADALESAHDGAREAA
ncbi:segregation and condensation protein A [Gemmatimonadetes bacterium T265]|nr:segregation and condensation protein A [Gemmatimonadetes bacterium T265]